VGIAVAFVRLREVQYGDWVDCGQWVDGGIVCWVGLMEGRVFRDLSRWGRGGLERWDGEI